MEYVQFGTAGVRVSRLALGMGLRGQADESEVERLILLAFERGINLFDCANVYGLMDDRGFAGRSEEILGRALRAHRDDVVITSKVASSVGSRTNDVGTSRYHIMREVERSLRRLGTDHIDVYLLHSFDSTTPLDEQLRALDDLTRQGKIRYVGACNYQAWQVCHALWLQDRAHASPLITVQNPYNLLNRSLESEMFPMVRALGLGVMAYAPLATGLLSGAYRADVPPPEGSLWGSHRREQFAETLSGRAADVLAVVEEIATRYGVEVPQVALAWVLAHPEITVAISGADTFRQLEQNLGALEVALDADDLRRLNDVSAGLTMVLDGPQFGPSVPPAAISSG
jgi:aryl-alcohol dehydrogenase-like predicted oxidoreductase